MSTTTTATTAFTLTPPEVITPVEAPQAVEAVPLKPEVANQVDEQVRRFIDALEKEDLHSEPFKQRLDSAFQLGRQEISIAANLMQGSLMQRNFVGATDTPAYKAIAAIREQLDELNPGKDGDLLQPRKLLGLIPFGNKLEAGIIGIVTNQEMGNFRLQTYTPLEAIGEGAVQSWYIVTGTFDYLSNLVTGRMKADQLGGPIRVAQASGQMATLGVAAVLQLAAVLSVSIGLLNLMPVPVLDGGHLMFYAVEAIRGKPVGPGAQEIAFRIGMALVLMLMVFATWNDISMLLG